MWHLVYACTYLHVAFCVGISVQASLITVVGQNGRHFLNMSIVTFGLYFTNIVFFLSYPTRVSCPVCSNKLCSNTDTVSRRLWASAGSTCLGFRLYSCMIDYLIPTRVVERWGNISQYTNLAQLNLRPQRDVKYECNSTAVCHRVFSEWVSQRIEGVLGVKFTIPQAPSKTSPSLSPPRLALFSIQSNTPIKCFNIPHFAADIL